MKLGLLQTQFGDSLFYKHEKIVAQIKETQSITPVQRLQVYRNSFIMSVTEALAMTYQHTLALVGQEFFNVVSRAFILSQPPLENNIMTYGDGFSHYLSHLPQLKSMPYISEMARFEWLLEQTSNLPLNKQVLDASELAELSVEQLNKVVFQLPTQISIFTSEQNITLLHQMLVEDQIVEVDLNAPCYLVLKKQQDFRVELISLEKEQILLLQQIQSKKNFEQLVELNLHQQLPVLLEQGLLSGFTVN